MRGTYSEENEKIMVRFDMVKTQREIDRKSVV